MSLWCPCCLAKAAPWLLHWARRQTPKVLGFGMWQRGVSQCHGFNGRTVGGTKSPGTEWLSSPQSATVIQGAEAMPTWWGVDLDSFEFKVGLSSH